MDITPVRKSLPQRTCQGCCQLEAAINMALESIHRVQPMGTPPDAHRVCVPHIEHPLPHHGCSCTLTACRLLWSPVRPAIQEGLPDEARSSAGMAGRTADIILHRCSQVRWTEVDGTLHGVLSVR